MRSPQVESLVFLGWCIRRGTRGEGDGDAEYLLSHETLLQVAGIASFLLQLFKKAHKVSKSVGTRKLFI